MFLDGSYRGFVRGGLGKRGLETQRPTRSNTNSNHIGGAKRRQGPAEGGAYGCCLCWTWWASGYLAGRWGAKGATLETITLSPFTPSPFVGLLIELYHTPDRAFTWINCLPAWTDSLFEGFP